MTKILAIDDNRDNLILLSALLAESFPGAEFIGTQSGKEGIEKCQSGKPDVVLIDMLLPDMESNEVCRILKSNEITGAIPIIMITAFDTDKISRSKALIAGADLFLSKPFDTAELTTQILVMLRIKKSEDQILNDKKLVDELVNERTEVLQNELRERNLVLEALQDSEEKYSILFLNSPDSYLIIKDGVFTDCNKATEEMMGGDRSCIIGKTPASLSPEFQPDGKKSTESAEEKISYAFKYGKNTFEWMHRRFDGSDLYVEVSIAPMILKGVQTLFTTWRDISARKMAENALKEKEIQFKEFFDKAADAIFIAELETGIIVDVNLSAARLMQIPREQIIGLHQSQIHPKKKEDFSVQNFREHDKLTEQDLPMVPLENEIVRPDGSLVPVEVMASRVFYKDKKCLMGTFRDISERKKVETMLRESEYFFKESQRAAFIGSYQFDIANDYWTSSEVLEQILGIGPKMNKKLQDWINIVLPEDREMMVKYFMEEVVGKKQQFNKEYRIFNQVIGEIRWVLGLGKLNFDAEGNVIEMIGTIQDITERKLSEFERGESHEFTESLLRTIPFGMDIVDEKGIILFQSANFENVFTTKAIGRRCWELYCDENTQCAECPLIKGIDIGKTGIYEASGILGGRVFEISHTGMMYNGKKAMLEIFQDITDRKRAEEELKESQQLFKGLFNASPDAIVLIDPHHPTISWPIVDCNEAACRMNGYSSEELIGRSIDLLSPSKVIPKERLAYLNTLRNEPIIQRELVHRHKDGYIFPVEVSSCLVTIGNREMVLTIYRDVTDRKKAEIELQQSQSTLRGILNNFPGEIFWKDLDLNYLGCNKAFSVSAHLSDPDEIKGKNDFELPWAESAAESYRSMDRQVIDTGIPFHNLLSAQIEADGKLLWLETSKLPIIDSEGKTIGILGVSHDITDFKMAEESLLASMELNNSLLQTIPYGMDIVDEEGIVLFQNNKLEDVFGKGAIGKKCWSLYRDDRLQCATCPLRRGIEIGETDTYITSGVLGGRIFEICHTGMMYNGKKAMLEIFQDITDRKRAEEELKESQQLFKGLFNASPDAIVLLDPHHPTISWPIVDCNEAACHMNGYTREELIGQSIDVLNLTIGNSEERVEYLERLKKTPVMQKETFHRHKDGHIMPIEVSTSVVTIGGKEMVLGIDRDITERKRTEQALFESESRYKSFISQISEGVYRFESDQPMDIHLPIEEQIDYIYNHLFLAECNKAFLEMYGMSDEKELLGKTQLDFHNGQDNLLNRSALREFIENGYRVENALTHEVNVHGQLVYFSNNALGIVDDNHLVRIWGTQSDISEKTRADQIQQVLYTISNAAYSSTDLPELIRQISQELGKLLDSTNFYIAFYDEKTDMLSTIYETDEKDVISSWPAGNSITGYVIKHRKSLLVSESEVMELCEAGEIEVFGTPSKVWLGVPLFTENKVAGALVVQSYNNPNAYDEKDQQILEFISHQISVSIERKKTEQELRLLGKAFKQSPVTIVITDKSGNIEYTNPKFSETTGYSQEEVKGKNSRILQSGEQSKEYYKNLWDTINSGNDWIGEFHNKRKNGESYWESAVISPITNELGEITFFLALKEDVTEKKKMIEDLIHARKEAEESDRLKSAFLANMSHEIRTPLNAIIGFSELIRDPAFEPEQQDEFAQLINDSGNNLLSILSDIMDISKIEAGQVSITKRKISVDKLITSIQKEFTKKADRKGIEIRIHRTSPGEVIEIETDETKIRQIIVNFLTNAIKFTETGYIELGIDPKPNFVRLYVKDTGIGIPSAYHEKVFERFRQVETSHTRKYGGNGLGLCISKNLTELLGGTIGMESEEGKGSLFYIVIPRN